MMSNTNTNTQMLTSNLSFTSNEQLVKFHSQQCNPTPKVLNTNFTNTEGETVCFGGVKIYDALCSNFKLIDKLMENEIIQDVQYLYDGSIIRVFYDEDWKLATNKCVNADGASWENLGSFGKAFREIAEQYPLNYDSLDKNNTYYFVLQHKLNRIVSPVMENKIIHINTFDNKTGMEINYVIDNVPKSEKVNISIDEILTVCLKSPWTFQGYLVKTASGKNIRIESKEYTRVRAIKGNMVSRGKNWKISDKVDKSVYRLLQIIRHENKEDFLYYFPEYTATIDSVIRDLQKLTHSIHNEYINYKVFKTITEVSLFYKPFIYKAHQIYLTTRQTITLADIYNLVMVSPFDTLMKAIEYKE